MTESARELDEGKLYVVIVIDERGATTFEETERLDEAIERAEQHPGRAYGSTIVIAKKVDRSVRYHDFQS